MSAFDYLFGTLFGDVIATPMPAVIPPRAVPGRKVALSILREYLSELAYARPDRTGTIITYSIPIAHIYTEQPKNVIDLSFPSIVFRPGNGEWFSKGPAFDESTRDTFGAGTCLVELGEWTETFTIECWAEEAPQRASMVATIETAMVPVEEIACIRFALHDYYDLPVGFTLTTAGYPDDPDVARNRRWAEMSVDMRFPIVRLANYVELATTLDIRVVG
jgi:hypothetical protein